MRTTPSKRAKELQAEASEDAFRAIFWWLPVISYGLAWFSGLTAVALVVYWVLRVRA